MMKQRLLKTIVLGLVLLGGVNVVSAQSNYTWNAANWSATCGQISVSDGTITATHHKYGCTGIKTTTSFQLPYKQTWIVVTGTNLTQNDAKTNPNVYNFNGNDLDSKINAKFVAADHTQIVFDVTSALPTTTDFFGNVIISSIGIYLNGGSSGGSDVEYASGTAPTVTNIAVYQPDWIDLCSSTENVLVEQGGSALSTTLSTTDVKKSLSFTATQTGEFHLKFTPSSAVKHNNSQVYLVLETSNTNTSVVKMNDLRVDSKQRGYASTGHNNQQHTLNNGNKLHLISPLNPEVADQGSTDLLDLYYNTRSFDADYLDLYLSSEAASAVNIYRCGLYSLSEIFQLYPELSNQAWRFWNTKSPMIEKDGTANKIIVNNSNGESEKNTVAMTVQMVRGLGSLPSYFTGLELHKFQIADGQIPTKEDIFANLPYVNNIIFGNANYKFFPTMNANVTSYFGNYGYYQYKDGTAPGSVAYTEDGGGSNKIASFTRNFVAGYSSCCLPFDITTSELPTGLSAYTFTSCTADGAVTFSTAGETIAAGTPFVVKAETAGYYLIPSASSLNRIESPDSYYATEASNNVKFVGSFVNKVPDGDYVSTNNYGINSAGNKFLKMKADTKTTFYRAFLASSNASFAPTLLFDDGNGTTDIKRIEDIDGMDVISDGAIYNLQGVRMNGDNLPKGIYVRNGKKFVVK